MNGETPFQLGNDFVPSPFIQKAAVEKDNEKKAQSERGEKQEPLSRS